MLQNVILKSGGNLPLATFSSERVKGIKGGCIDGTVLKSLSKGHLYMSVRHCRILKISKVKSQRYTGESTVTQIQDIQGRDNSSLYTVLLIN